MIKIKLGTILQTNSIVVPCTTLLATLLLEASNKYKARASIHITKTAINVIIAMISLCRFFFFWTSTQRFVEIPDNKSKLSQRQH